MSSTAYLRDLPRRAGEILKEAGLVLPVGVAAGLASALFLWSLDRVTELRFDHVWLIFLLPLAGVWIAWVYSKFGDKSAAGNNLILEEIHAPGGGIPRRLAPLVLVATLVTHLFGGSAGREGTAVQMGGGLAGSFARLFKLDARKTRLLLMAGVAAGFGSVFGTPLAGAVFAIEVLVVGQMRHDVWVPLFVASFVGDLTCRAVGITHTVYPLAALVNGVTPLLLLKAAALGVLFGLAGFLFVSAEKTFKGALERFLVVPWLRPVVGGAVVLAFCLVLGTRDYLGLSVAAEHPGSVTLRTCFEAGGVETWSWVWKLLLTALTLAAGFKGGETTPLFFIGAALGNVLAPLFGIPVDLGAALGFVAVFAGASNTPFACTLMAVELFRGQDAVLFAIACFFAYLFSGYDGLYRAQRGRLLKYPFSTTRLTRRKGARELALLVPPFGAVRGVDGFAGQGGGVAGGFESRDRHPHECDRGVRVARGYAGPAGDGACGHFPQDLDLARALRTRLGRFVAVLFSRPATRRSVAGGAH